MVAIFLENSENLDPVLIHFNYIVGDHKRSNEKKKIVGIFDHTKY